MSYFNGNHGAEPRHMTVVLSGGLGDCLLATPFLRHFKQEAGYHFLKCVVPSKAHSLFSTNPYIDQLDAASGTQLFFHALPEARPNHDVFSPYVEVRLSGTNSGLEIDHLLSANTKDTNVIQQVADYHSIDLVDAHMDVFVPECDKQWARDFAIKMGDKPLLFFSPYSALSEKDLPETTIRQTLEQLEDKFQILQMLADGRLKVGAEIVQPSLLQSAALFQHLACVLSVDSFPGHLAAALCIPSVVLFGPSNPNAFSHSGQLALRPSSCPHCSDTIRRQKCMHSSCMDAFTPGKIVAAVQECVNVSQCNESRKLG